LKDYIEKKNNNETDDYLFEYIEKKEA